MALALIACEELDIRQDVTNGNLRCLSPLTVINQTQLNTLIDDRIAASSPTNMQLTYEDFTLLGGGILGMFIIAYSLKQIRLVINR